MRDLVVKPSMGRRIGFAVICAIFTIAGIAMLFSGEFTGVIFGLAAIALFGVGGVWYFVRLSRGTPTFVLTRQGIVPGSGGFVPWQNVGRIGKTRTGDAAALGVEVLNVPAYIASLTPDQRRTAMRMVGGARIAGPGLAAAGGGSDAMQLSDIPTGDLVAATHWAAQQSGGYHLTFPALALNQSIPKLAAEVERYRAAALGWPRR